MSDNSPKNCGCPCHKGAPIFCSCFVPCCSRPNVDMRAPKLLSRDAFREGVFARDNHKCVLCQAPAVDAHHILERRLWPDGGYYLENGSSLCGTCHYEAEKTTVSCERIREACGITKLHLPPHLYSDQPYDKWGNPVLPNGTRLRGELFLDESVQKILGEGGVLGLFTHHVKFPRTYHLPWSPGVTKDDRIMGDRDPFAGQQVVVTVKMDGENTTMYRDYIHARSLTFEPHASRNWVKTLWARIAHEIPEGWRLCGENLFAEHSIKYTRLADYFQLFSVWNDRNECLSWAETKEWAELLGLRTVPVLYEGDGALKNLPMYQPLFEGDACEGYVVRLNSGFAYSTYRQSVGKFVRANHVVTHGHWMRQQVRPNGLRSAS